MDLDVVMLRALRVRDELSFSQGRNAYKTWVEHHDEDLETYNKAMRDVAAAWDEFCIKLDALCTTRADAPFPVHNGRPVSWRRVCYTAGWVTNLLEDERWDEYR